MQPPSLSPERVCLGAKRALWSPGAGFRPGELQASGAQNTLGGWGEWLQKLGQTQTVAAPTDGGPSPPPGVDRGVWVPKWAPLHAAGAFLQNWVRK